MLGGSIIKISELYKAPQGEGPCLGVQSVFVRLAICNLKCVWCDTPFTWDTKHPAFQYERYAPEMVAAGIKTFGVKHVVFTGGEPMLQAKELEQVMELLGYDYLMEVETAGTYAPTQKMESLVHQWSVSLKLEHSGNPLHKRIVPEAIKRFARMQNAWFKFVVQKEEDVLEIQGLQHTFGLVPSHIILMPEGNEMIHSLLNSVRVSEMAEKFGFRFSPRMQVLLYGAERKR